jgi:hypothetical protein
MTTMTTVTARLGEEVSSEDEPARWDRSDNGDTINSENDDDVSNDRRDTMMTSSPTTPSIS